jgi:hypothetical protein
MLNASIRKQIQSDSYAVNALYPRPKGRGFTAKLGNRPGNTYGGQDSLR